MAPARDIPPSREALAARAARDAAAWLATLSDEACSAAERDGFFEWLRASTRHVDEFLRLSALASCASRRALWPDDNTESLIAAARAHANVAELPASPEGGQTAERPRFRWALAASIAGLAILALALLAGPAVRDLVDPAYVTGVGEQRSITLEDGSVIELNSQSRLRARFTDDVRAIELERGEAVFRVARDLQRPFRVRTGGTDIVALGTAFNVRANDARTVVTVLHGRVRVDSRHDGVRAGRTSELVESFELQTGEQLILAPQAPAMRIALPEPEKAIAWTERRLLFEDTRVDAAATEFARYSPRRIRIEDPRLAARRINGVFDATDPASLVEFLETDETVRVRVENGEWVISAASDRRW